MNELTPFQKLQMCFNIIIVFFICLLMYITITEIRKYNIMESESEQLQTHVGGSEALNPHEIHRREYHEDKIVCYYTQRWGQCFWSNLN